jgi:hypothetical protein
MEIEMVQVQPTSAKIILQYCLNDTMYWKKKKEKKDILIWTFIDWVKTPTWCHSFTVRVAVIGWKSVPMGYKVKTETPDRVISLGIHSE